MSPRGSTTLMALAFALGLGACSEAHSSEHPEAPPAPKSRVALCGKTGQPDCPLQSWMKATLQPYLRTADMSRLAVALDQLAEKSPPGFAGWSDSAHAAAEAARANDIARVKSECQSCHDHHRSRFRSELREVALF